jgi:hypothetical protein
MSSGKMQIKILVDCQRYALFEAKCEHGVSTPYLNAYCSLSLSLVLSFSHLTIELGLTAAATML